MATKTVTVSVLGFLEKDRRMIRNILIIGRRQGSDLPVGARQPRIGR